MKPFRRTGFNVPLNCPLPKCRARGRGAKPPAPFFCFVFVGEATKMKSRQRNLHYNLSLRQNNFVRFFHYACLFDYLDNGRRIGTCSGRAGLSFSARPEKEAKGAVLHGTSAAERSRHVKSRSANLPKLDDSHRLKHMGRFVFALWAKIPSRATQSDPAGAASASRRRPAAHKNTGYENDQKPC